MNDSYASAIVNELRKLVTELQNVNRHLRDISHEIHRK
jgi:hypothetical protein